MLLDTPNIWPHCANIRSCDEPVEEICGTDSPVQLTAGWLTVASRWLVCR